MMISTKGRYALRLMIDIAEQGEDARVPLREVAERQGISIKYLEQLAGSLVRAGLLKSTRGARGGYVLTRSSDEMTAGDVLRAAEGSCAPVACLEDDFGVCPRRSECNTIAFWEGLDKTIENYVDGVTLGDLVKKPGCVA
ncbi:RrF2 family transcriptional regulator [Raoultibacter massiliensis]|uniref:Rrf2 family transcriptional regulator n=1 Tax=Raoultibacter massiliensis TaxID=1852371 RepID=A0ABV1JES3_9ACTN|nr:Rrf2 family transcriptional regulator [Raoultibacter massiliensis]